MIINDYIKISQKKPNGETWKYAEKIEILSNPPTFYHYFAQRDGQFLFVKDSVFLKFSRNEKTSKRLRLKEKDEESINFINEINQFKLKSGCKLCGYNKHPQSLSFDHREPLEKNGQIGSMVFKYSTTRLSKREQLKAKIYQEIEKCDVLCFNCHAYKTYINKCGQKKLLKDYETLDEYLLSNKKQTSPFLSLEVDDSMFIDEWVAVAPDKTIHEFSNMAEFASAHNLDRHSLADISNVNRSRGFVHRGWLCYRKKNFSLDQMKRDLDRLRPKYKVTSPEGKEYFVRVLRKFNVDNNLPHNYLYSVLVGHSKKSGWKVRLLTEEELKNAPEKVQIQTTKRSVKKEN